MAKVYVLMEYAPCSDKEWIAGIYNSKPLAEEARDTAQASSQYYIYSIEDWELKGKPTIEEKAKQEDKERWHIALTLHHEPYLLSLTLDQIRLLHWLEDHKVFDEGAINEEFDDEFEEV